MWELTPSTRTSLLQSHYDTPALCLAHVCANVLDGCHHALRRVLDATNNALRELPASITALINLQRLVLANNALVNIPAGLLPAFTNLKFVNLDANQLTALPDDIGALQKLEKLTVANNRLAALPNTLTSCSRLQHLVASGNALTELPPQLPSEVEDVDVSNNRLQVRLASCCQCVEAINYLDVVLRSLLHNTARICCAGYPRQLREPVQAQGPKLRFKPHRRRATGGAARLRVPAHAVAAS
jgi:hypothetical protein